MSSIALDSDSPQAEYEAKCMAVAMNLQRYYNQCVGIMLANEEGGLTPDEKMEALAEMDRTWAKTIVDDIAPLKPIIQVDK